MPLNLRWPLVASIVALLAGVVLAALVLALCGEESEGPQVRGTPRVTRTAVVGTRTPRAGTPLRTPTPAEETPTPEGALTATLTPTPASPTPSATSTPETGPRPDLTVLDLGVFRDQIVVVVSNAGEGPVAAGAQIDISVRGILADSVILDEDLLPGDNLTAVLSGQVIYRPEVVLAQVDPNNRIAEQDEGNNTLTGRVEPDITPDLGLTGLAAVGSNRHLAVDVANTTQAPIRQAAVTLEAYRCGSTSVITAMEVTLDLDPLGSTRIEFVPEVIVAPAVCMAVVMEVSDIPDADEDNNVFEGTIP